MGHLRYTTAAATLLAATTAGMAQEQIDVPPQPLASALAELSAETGLDIVAADRLTVGHVSRGATGLMTPGRALTALLADTGLQARVLPTGAAVVEVTQGAQEPVLLDPIVLAAEEARAGILGDQPIQDIPFSVTSYTEDLVERTQARRLSDVLDNDPAVRNGFGPNVPVEFPIIRGFPIFNSEVSVDGLYGMTWRGAALMEQYSRVEILRGPNALVNGLPPDGSVGGAINLITKSPIDIDFTELTFGFESDANFGLHLDTSRRFGAQREFGVRFNGAFRGGDLTIDDASSDIGQAGLALDYEVGRLRLTGDFYYANEKYDAPFQQFVATSNDFRIPAAPDSRTRVDQPYSTEDVETLRGIVGLEYDITDNVTAALSYGRLDGTAEIDRVASFFIENAEGDTSAFALQEKEDLRRQSLTGSLRGFFQTGPVSHQASLQASYLWGEGRRRINSSTDPSLVGGTIYNPISIPRPDLGPLPNNGFTDLLERTSVAISDVVGFFDDRLLVTLGARWQDIELNDDESQSEISPAFAVLYKPNERLSFYGSYSEALTPGRVAPSQAVNGGEFLDPFVADQFEIGAKWSSNGLSASLAVFQITQEQGILDPDTNVFSADGETRNRGIEFLVSGDVTDQFRLLGGLLRQDGEQVNTEGGRLDGNTSIAVPDTQFNLYGEYDVAAVPGLTVNGRVIYTSEQFLDAENRQSIPAWTQFDVGASYDTEVSGRLVSFNLDVLNVTDDSFWQSTGRSRLTLSRPRTVRFSTTVSF